MKVPLKLNSIDQEHLQELYAASGVSRDELPYTEAFQTMVEGFQDRTFKNADPEQLFGAILKYTRTGGNSSTEQPPDALDVEKLKQLRAVLSHYLSGGKLLPYSDEFNAARTEFTKVSKMEELSEQDFWRMVLRALGSKRRPPPKAKKASAKAKASVPDDDDGE